MPITFRWQGDGFTPLPRLQGECDRRFVVGGFYRLVEWEDRSQTSHDHQFAWLAEAWASLPENLKDQYPSPTHLRKRALINGGFYDEEIIDVGTNAGALRVAGYARKHDEFALVIVRGGFVVVRTAKSQSRRAMDRETFQRAKDSVLEIVADLIGVTPEALAKQGEAA